MRSFFFGMLLNRMLKRSNGLLQLSSSVETQSEEIREARRIGFQLESSLKGLDGAFGFAVLTEPNAQSFIGVRIGVGVDSRLQRRRTDARSRPNRGCEIATRAAAAKARILDRRPAQYKRWNMFVHSSNQKAERLMHL